jgi:signal transduction histidine kinase
MRDWKLRTRVALTAALAIFLAVALVGIAIQLLLARDLRRQLDSTLRQRAVDVATLSASAPALLTTPGALDSAPATGALDVEVVDRDGRIVARSLALGARVLPAQELVDRAVRNGDSGYANATMGGDDLRIYAAPLADVGGGPAAGGAVVVASTTDQVDGTLDRLRQLTVLAGLAAAAVAVPLALGVTRRVLQPLERLTSDAAEIRRTADPSRRLPTSGGEDEVQQLAVALNDMLAALERARDAERRFLADASHELRTPLTALRGNAAYLARHGADEVAFADLEADVARLSALVDGLLAVAREDAAGPPAGVVDVTAVVTSLDPDRRLHVSAEPGLAVRGDGDAIGRALANLVENARRYGPPGGSVEVDARRDGGAVVLSVTDAGAGIPGVSVEQASTRFWRGPNSVGTQGSGLGLALVRATAERHGGRLVIDGARFAIELPALTDLSEDTDHTAAVLTHEEGTP